MAKTQDNPTLADKPAEPVAQPETKPTVKVETVAVVPAKPKVDQLRPAEEPNGPGQGQGGYEGHDGRARFSPQARLDEAGEDEQHPDNGAPEEGEERPLPPSEGSEASTEDNIGLAHGLLASKGTPHRPHPPG
jgi:hypothetical protein